MLTTDKQCFRAQSLQKWTCAACLAIVIACTAAPPPKPIAGLVEFEQGNDYLRQEMFYEALHSYEEAIAKNPAQPLYYLNCGVVQHRLLLYHAAIESYQKALDRDDSIPLAWHNIALAHTRLGNMDLALQAYAEYKQLTGAQKDMVSQKEAAP